MSVSVPLSSEPEPDTRTLVLVEIADAGRGAAKTGTRMVGLPSDGVALSRALASVRKSRMVPSPRGSRVIVGSALWTSLLGSSARVTVTSLLAPGATVTVGGDTEYAAPARELMLSSVRRYVTGLPLVRLSAMRTVLDTRVALVTFITPKETLTAPGSLVT